MNRFTKLSFPQALFLISGFVLLVGLPSCKHGKKKTQTSVFSSSAYLDPEAFASGLRTALKPVDTTDSTFRKKKMIAVDEAFRLTYQLNEYEPLWFNAKGVSPAAVAFVKEIDSLDRDGLNSLQYRADFLKEQLAKLQAAKSPAISEVISFDTACTRIYLRASKDLLLGSVVPKKADSLWFHANDSSWHAHEQLVKALGEGDDYPSLAAYRSKIPVYAVLQRALQEYAVLRSDSAVTAAKAAIADHYSDSLAKIIITAEMKGYSFETNDSVKPEQQLLQAFQWFNKQKLTGKPDSTTIALLSRAPDSVINIIRANLERLRWLPQQLEDNYVIVNVPLMELVYHRNDEDTMRMRVVVGRLSRQTPSLNARMANIVFNPSWGVPPTILKKDVLPGLTQSGAKYLSKKGLRAYDHKGNPVDAGSINESNYKRYIYKQAPGDDNSLGVVKFNLPNPYDIYLHDTPHKEDFPMFSRALSSGCIRVQNPRGFANYILTSLDQKPRFTPGYIDSIVQTHKTRYEILKTKIPVHIVYLTAYHDSSYSQVRFLSDVYKRDSRLIALMK